MRLRDRVPIIGITRSGSSRDEDKMESLDEQAAVVDDPRTMNEESEDTEDIIEMSDDEEGANKIDCVSALIPDLPWLALQP